jgi:hypothetical protein
LSARTMGCAGMMWSRGSAMREERFADAPVVDNWNSLGFAGEPRLHRGTVDIKGPVEIEVGVCREWVRSPPPGSISRSLLVGAPPTGSRCRAPSTELMGKSVMARGFGTRSRESSGAGLFAPSAELKGNLQLPIRTLCKRAHLSAGNILHSPAIFG